MLTKEAELKLRVFYTWSQKEQDNYDTDFNRKIDWDIPLLEGYEYQFIQNLSKNPGIHHYNGIDCPSLNKEIENWQATHILVFGWNFKAHFKAMRHFKGKIPVLFRGDSTLLDYNIINYKQIFEGKNIKSQILYGKSYIKYLFRKAFLTYIYNKIDTAFYVGTNNKDYFVAHGLKENQLVFVPHAIDNERFFDSYEKQYEEKAKKWRQDLDIKKNDRVILFAGKLEKKKNPQILLDAFTHIKKNNPNFKLIFLGSGELEKDLKSKSSNLNDVYFLPFQNQSMMPVVYRLGDIFCLPSQGPGETWGLAVNEALACNRPVLVSDKVGCAYDLVNIKTGSVFESNDRISLQNSLINFNLYEPQWNASLWSFHNISKNIIAFLNS
ncbi:glycosyltransferase family 4 protein [Plebeiibacterium sediminum]|uniref:Glycosyltransferase family 4 protein n=1 Tax=Plebeiibacterium sediminum TaxID=2992112 RepID=A0AAE3M8Z6_9BACT|nr:glycosyltransferase family 4 protein [Plebeiobacterium sediminum]MCW3789201.1 glycosyltransferase family 4 protein [Plebeiobacterium sediminum]